MNDREQIQDELTYRLREYAEAEAKDHLEHHDELARLREELESRRIAYNTGKEAELARLRGALEMLVDGYGHTWPMSVLSIVRNALKGTT